MISINGKQILWLFKIALLSFIIVICQLLIIPHLSIYDAVPSLALTFITLISLAFGLEAGIPVGLSMAIIYHNFLYKPTFLFDWCIVPLIAAFIKPALSLEREAIWIIQVGLCSFLIELINLLFMLLSHQSLELDGNSIGFSLANLFLIPLMNIILAVPVLALIKKTFSISDFDYSK
ncbi:MAG: hypothetical protein QNJ31_07835 [Candidatus Caenarcaniphilales bacterium]|nr:hypothetical protein [Candidatus Caenarcaniphilales bacterium]